MIRIYRAYKAYRLRFRASGTGVQGMGTPNNSGNSMPAWPKFADSLETISTET